MRISDLKFRNHHLRNARTPPLVNPSDDIKTQVATKLKKEPEAKLAEVHFANGHYMSIATGPHFHTNRKRPYEAWLQTYENQPRGYLTEQELQDFLDYTEALPSKT